MNDIFVIRAHNVRNLKRAGVLEKYLDSEDYAPKINISKIPFSKYYNTYDEYVLDKNRALEISAQDKEIPQDLLNKLYKTAIELGITSE